MPKGRKQSKKAVETDGEKLGVKDKGISKPEVKYSQFKGDKRVIPSVVRDGEVEFKCKCGTYTHQILLPAVLPIHPKFKCCECRGDDARCMVCNKKAKNPTGESPYKTREDELAISYCEEHIGCVAPDPEWKSFW